MLGFFIILHDRHKNNHTKPNAQLFSKLKKKTNRKNYIMASNDTLYHQKGLKDAQQC